MIATAKPSITRNFVGSVSDLKNFVQALPDDVEGMETIYEFNVMEDPDTGEKWLEIEPHE